MPSFRESFHHYLPVNDEAVKWGLYLTGGGRAHIQAGQDYPPPGHPSLYRFDWRRGRTLPEFQVLLISEGRGFFESQVSERQDVGPKTLLLLFPGVWHRYRPDPDAGWAERWLSLNGQTVHQLMDLQFITPTRPVFSCPDADGLSRRFDALLDHIHRHPTENSILLSLRAMGFIAEVIEQTKTPPLTTSPQPEPIADVADPLVARTLELIWTHSHRPLSVGQLVDSLTVSRRTLERRFALERSHSILDEINICRVNRAKRLLAETDLPIKTVAYLAGFTSQEHMRVTYRKQQGCSPNAYRKRAQTRNAVRSTSPRS